MKYNPLGRTNVKVSEICLGTMTWGTQNSEAEGHAQMDCASDAGVNFFDTAEMYPTNPLSAETQGRTEEIIGTWFKASGKRDDIVLATKVTGDGVQWVREGAAISPDTIRTALEGSLRRLQTDYIDLYQLHWPNRGSYHFRKNWVFDPTGQNCDETRAHIAEVLRTLDDLVKEGKIRHIGLSNESCWGTSQFLNIASVENLPRVVSIQNEYSLLYRQFDLDLAELAHNENVGLLAYSPLGAGILSGKYRGDVIPDGSRRTFRADLNGRYTPQSEQVVAEYLEVAKLHSLDPCQMAIAFCLARPFMMSAIIGATTMEQLKTNIAATETVLSDDVMADIQAIYRKHPMPI